MCPVIDTIDWNTFEFYMQTDEPMIGGFDWRLTFQWHAVPEADRNRRKSRIEPIRSVPVCSNDRHVMIFERIRVHIYIGVSVFNF